MRTRTKTVRARARRVLAFCLAEFQSRVSQNVTLALSHGRAGHAHASDSLSLAPHGDDQPLGGESTVWGRRYKTVYTHRVPPTLRSRTILTFAP